LKVFYLGGGSVWLLRGAVKNKEYAKWWLEHRRDQLTEEEVKYLMHVIEEGERAERYIRECEEKEKEKKGSPSGPPGGGSER
jgi:hypothetical protein